MPKQTSTLQIESIEWPSLLLVMLAGLAAYWNSFQGIMVFDDRAAIVDQSNIRHLWPLRLVFNVPPDSILAGRPIVTLSLALNYAVGGLGVVGYHAVNLALHILNGWLLLKITTFAFSTSPLVSWGSGTARFLALASVLVWTVHPLLTDAVTYLAQRTELLMSFWLLLTLWCTIRSAASRVPHRWHAMAIVACALGMASKQVMVVAPLLIGLFDWLFLAPNARHMWVTRRCLYLGLAASWLLLLALLTVTDARQVAGFHFSHLTPLDYLRTQCGVLVHYLHLSVWPHPLVIDYDDWPIAKSWFEVALPTIVVVCLLSVSIWAIIRKHRGGFLGAWVFLILAPTSSILPLISEVVAERRMYLPLYALTVLAVIGVWHLLQFIVHVPAGRRRVAFCIVGVVVGGLTVMTMQRNEDYRSSEALWKDTIAHRPLNARAHYSLGRTLHAEGRLPEAVRAYEDGLRLRPNDVGALGNLTLAHAQLGELDKAVARCAEAVRADPSFADAHLNCGIAYVGLGRLAEAISHYETALRLNPADAQVHANLGSTLAQLGHLDDAIHHYEAALRLDPNGEQASNIRAELQFALLRRALGNQRR